MDETTYKALLGAIELWKRNAADPQRANYYANVNPLCQLFYAPASKGRVADKDICSGCPVRLATGEYKCNATPFPIARHLIDSYRRAGCRFRDVARACKDHVALLESLAPAKPPSDDDN